MSLKAAEREKNYNMKNVAVFFGGMSVEHEVSIISAVQAMNSMNREKYNILPIYITKSGEMIYSKDFMNIDLFRTGPLEKLAERYTKVYVARNGDNVCIIPIKSGFFCKSKTESIDIAFPIVHGTNCEDGTMQGFFELLGVPYVGCDIVSSSLGMDKVLFKSALDDAGIPVLKCESFYAREWIDNKDEIIDTIEKSFDYPVIVKPANLGSSVGISKASSRDALIEAVTLASSFATKILVERAVTGLREINCSVLGDSDECQASVCEEPVMSDEILSYQDKYINGAKSGKNGSEGMSSLKRRIPADIDESKRKEIEEIACKTFRTLGCNGVVRIDFMLDTDDNDKVYVNEINTIPGSLAFYLWEASGMKYPELIDRMIELGFKRARIKKNLMFTYNTNILDGVGALGGSKGSKGSKF